MDFLKYFHFVFSMAISRRFGSGVGVLNKLGLTDEEIHEVITTHVTMDVRVGIQEVFGSIKTSMIDMFNKCYAAVSKGAAVIATAAIAVAGLQGRGAM